jgi:probable F420-dependent oxidoreductase
MDLGSFGVWWSGGRQAGLAADEARAVEQLGYGAIWASGRQEPGIDPGFADTLAATSTLVVATGIVNIWKTPADELTSAYFELEDAHPGRFLLGLGASHSARVDGYHHPYSRMLGYLDALDACRPAVPAPRRVLAALRPKMLALSAARSLGAHPYFVPTEHTRLARQILGPGPLLAPEVTVALETDPDRARALAREFTARYLALPNYSRNLEDLGYPADELAGAGSDRVVDAVVAWGEPAAVADRVRAHLEAGADHACLQVLSATRGFPLGDYETLAAELLR